HLKDRPVTVERLPDGLAKPSSPRFWQKNTPDFYPEWIRRIELPSEAGKRVQYALVNDLDTLLYFVNQGAITFHVYMSRVKSLERRSGHREAAEAGDAGASHQVPRQARLPRRHAKRPGPPRRPALRHPLDSRRHGVDTTRLERGHGQARPGEVHDGGGAEAVGEARGCDGGAGNLAAHKPHASK